MTTINCKGHLIDLSIPKVMGIINLTPDSFYDGGKYKKIDQVLSQVDQMLSDGATFIDIGAYSSRPGALDVSIEEEKKRLLPIIKKILQTFPNSLLSIDTFRSEVAQQCVLAGAAIINDISAGSLDSQMMQTVANLRVPYIMMHMKGTPQTMSSLNQYDDLLKDIQLYFAQKISNARALGIHDLIIDPGFGFAKDVSQNFELLQKMNLLSFQDVPLLAGLSRKSMIYKTLNTTPDFALNGTSSLNTVALLKGASILRVHDVKEVVECVSLLTALNSSH